MEKKESTQSIVDAYTNSWISGDFQKARSYLADDIDFRGSLNQFTDAESLIAALEKFTKILKSVDFTSRFYEGNEAMLMYDYHTDSPAGSIRTVEYFRVERGKIKEIKVVYDATELRKMMWDQA